MAFFTVSLILALVLMYIVGRVWFASMKSHYLLVFSIMGVMASLWSLLNGVSHLITSPEVFGQIQVMWMIFVCCIPFLMLLYIMHFVGFRWANSRLLTGLLVLLMCADVALLVTNPLHMLFYTSYTPRGNGVYGPLFWAHNIATYAALAAAFLLLVVHVARNARKHPELLLLLTGSAFPFVLNILHVYRIFRVGDYDLTPLGFVAMFSVYGFFSIRYRLFNLKNAASASIFDTLSEGFLIVNDAGRIEEANPAFRGAFPALPQREGMTIRDVADYIRSRTVRYSPDDLFERMTDLQDNLAGGECSVRVEDGQVRDFALAKDFIHQRESLAGFVLTFTDISSYRRMIIEINQQNVELKRLKDDAEAASRAKGDFLANMSHEIRTPMNAIIGMTAIARDSAELDEIYGFLDKLDNASHQLLSIINDILDMSKIEANKLELHHEDFDLWGMLRDCLDMFADRAREKRQELRLDIAEDTPSFLFGDKLRLSQVVLNILSNAIKFTPEDGEIRLSTGLVSVTGDRARIRVSVKDSGIGMTEEQLSRLFTAFEQADGSISRRFGGTGLGLAISKSIVGLMGGEIWAESEPGQGATFHFEFEAELGREPVEAAALEKKEHYDFTGRTILLAEDVEINREIILTLMKDTGARIRCAENGQQAYELYMAAPADYDIIYMDIQMPKVDGYMATRMIRELPSPRAQSVPIIAMTANAFAEDIQRCKEAGMDDHISKPIDIGELFQKTAFYLERA